MNKLGAVVIKYCEGRINKEEMNEMLARYDIHGVVEGHQFTGYDYENHIWIELHLGCKGKSEKIRRA